MQKDIDVLIKIQDKDIIISSLKEKAERLPEDLGALQKDVRDAEERLKEKKEEGKRLQVARKEMEGDIEAKQEEIRKYSTQLYQLKTNEEYKAMEKQITDLKFNCGLIEDKILEKMEEIEQAQNEIRCLEETVGKTKKGLADGEKEIKIEIETVNTEIKKVEKEREGVTQGINPDFLRKYEQIFKNKHGAALVAISNRTCQGCHMILPPNVVNEVRRGEKIIICENCARILYYPG